MTAIDFSSALQAQLFPKIQSRLDAAIEALDDGDFKVIELQVTRWNPEVDQARLAPVALAEFFGWAIGQPWELPDEAASLSGPPKGKVSPAAENNLTLVGALLELLLPTYHGKQDALIADLPDKFPGVKGLGESNLKHKFADAKKSLGNAQQTAQLKVKKK
ncbi:MAG: hypothetical protein JNK40_02695 [Chromatiales bacterium]|nr:hypothetical protein [Chromatiales bacterium]